MHCDSPNEVFYQVDKPTWHTLTVNSYTSGWDLENSASRDWKTLLRYKFPPSDFDFPSFSIASRFIVIWRSGFIQLVRSLNTSVLFISITSGKINFNWATWRYVNLLETLWIKLTNHDPQVKATWFGRYFFSFVFGKVPSMATDFWETYATESNPILRFSFTGSTIRK